MVYTKLLSWSKVKSLLNLISEVCQLSQQVHSLVVGQLKSTRRLPNCIWLLGTEKTKLKERLHYWRNRTILKNLVKDWLWDDKYLLLKLLTTPDYLFLLIFIFLLPSKSLTKPCKGASGRGKINKQTNKQTNNLVLNM